MTSTNKCDSSEWLGELVRGVGRGVHIVHCDGLRLYLFHEKMDTNKKMPHALVVAGEAGGELDERLVIHFNGAWRVHSKTQLCQDVAEIEKVSGGLNS